MESPSGDSASKTLKSMFLALVGVGVVWRIVFVLSGRPLWLDSAMLALNVVTKPFGELAGPLDMNQAAPLGFLTFSRAVFLICGKETTWLLLVPLVAGILALLVFGMAARRALPGLEALLVLVPISIGTTGIYFSGEFKQYSSELLVNCVILWLAVRSEKPVAKPRFATLVAAVTILGPLFSFTSLITLPLLLIFLSIRGPFRVRRWPDAAGILILFLYLVAAYWLLIRPLSNSALTQYHQSGFPPTGILSIASWWIEGWCDFVAYPLNLDPRFILPLVLPILGLVLPKPTQGPAWRWFAFMAILGFMAASQLELYPFYGGVHDVNSRFVVQLVPFVLLLSGQGVVGLRRASTGIDRHRPASTGRMASWILIIVFIGAVVSHRSSARRYIWEDVPAAADHITEQMKETDCIWVYRHAVPQFRLATLETELAFTPGTAPGGSSVDTFERDLSRLDSCHAIWIVVSHDFNGERRKVNQAAENLGYRVTTSRFRGASAGLATSESLRNPGDSVQEHDEVKRDLLAAD